jgi:hypothetical protein
MPPRVGNGSSRAASTSPELDSAERRRRALEQAKGVVRGWCGRKLGRDPLPVLKARLEEQLADLANSVEGNSDGRSLLRRSYAKLMHYVSAPPPKASGEPEALWPDTLDMLKKVGHHEFMRQERAQLLYCAQWREYLPQNLFATGLPYTLNHPSPGQPAISVRQLRCFEASVRDVSKCYDFTAESLRRLREHRKGQLATSQLEVPETYLSFDRSLYATTEPTPRLSAAAESWTPGGGKAPPKVA